MRRLFNFFGWGRERMERDLDRELRYHVERRTADLVGSGMTEDKARRQAAIEFGGIAQAQEEVRETWVWRWLNALARDLRYAMRSLRKNIGFTVGAGAVLALGIGANTAIFSVVNTVLLQPLAYPDAERLVSLETLWTNTGRTDPEVAGADFYDWEAQNGAFEAMAYFSGEDDLSAVVNGNAVFVNWRAVSPDFFSVLGQKPFAGRLLSRSSASDWQSFHVAVVSYEWARTHFGKAERAVGKPFTLYGRQTEIVGVAAPGFAYPQGVNVWTPGEADRSNRTSHNIQAIARLKPGVGLDNAQAQMKTIAERLASTYPDNRNKSASVTSLHKLLTGRVQTTLWLLMGAVVLVLLIACANIANLLLARSANRAREIALRAALGAGRGRVARQLLTENLVLAALSTGAGLLLAYVLVKGIVALSPIDLPRIGEVRIDTPVLLFTIGLSLVSTLLFGLVPALSAARLDLSEALKQGGLKGAVLGSGRLRSALVVTEVALSVMLLAGAGLLLRSFNTLHQVDLGFATERVVTAYTQYAVTDVESRQRRLVFYRELLDKVRTLPGVKGASGVAFLPLGKEPRPPVEYVPEGRPEGKPGEQAKAEYQVVTPGYFQTLSIPIREGRDFNESDTPESTPVAIINERLAREAFPGQSSIGKRIRPTRSKQWFEIVGVTGDTRWRNPSETPPPEIFVAGLQGRGGSMSILVRTSLDTEIFAQTLRAVLHEMNSGVPSRFETMEEMFAGSLAYPRFRTQIVGGYAAMAALLAAVGIFSLLAYLVGQRTREIAVRRAVGARAVDVIRLITVQGLRLVAAGLVIGLAAALAVARLLEGLLYEISPWDLGAYAGAVAVLGIAALLATLLPALRAATIDPLTALRHE